MLNLRADALITPRKGWGGAGVLGLVARYDSFSENEDHVLFVKVRLSLLPLLSRACCT